MSIPTMMMALLILSTLGTEDINLIVGIGVIYMPNVARVMRSAVLEEKVKEYVAAAQMRGESTAYILFREILPNILSPMIVEASIRFGYSILLSASLGFLGLGVQPPTPDWGLDVNKGRPFLITAPWIILGPAAAMSLLVIGVSLLGDGIQQTLGVSGERRAI
jgi:peptide/nickel transport system permease protein